MILEMVGYTGLGIMLLCGLIWTVLWAVIGIIEIAERISDWLVR